MVREFEEELIALLKERGSLATVEIYDAFPQMNKATIAWHLHDCVKQGLVRRIGPGGGRGKYLLVENRIASDEKLKSLNEYKKRVFDFLCSLGYPFYVSGFDALEFNLDCFPVIICADKNNTSTIQFELMKNFDFAITSSDRIEKRDKQANMKRFVFYILEAKDFNLQVEHFAIKEKAFVDLYYAVTRLNYPFPVEELPYLLGKLNPNERRFHFATKDMKLAHELDFLLSYNKDFLKAFVGCLK